jgi:hypothetical protein
VATNSYRLCSGVVDENVDTVIDFDLEWQRELDRPCNRRATVTLDEHSLIGLHGWSVAQRRVSGNDAEYPAGPRHRTPNTRVIWGASAARCVLAGSVRG